MFGVRKYDRFDPIFSSAAHASESIPFDHLPDRYSAEA